MRKAFKSILSVLIGLSIVIPMVLTPMPAQANPAEEKIVQIRTPQYDIWKHEDGSWQYTGKPGDRKTASFPVEMPEKFKNGYKNIRVEVKNGPVTEDDNNDPNLEARYKKNWDTYNKTTLVKSAEINNRSVTLDSLTLDFTKPRYNISLQLITEVFP